MIDDIDDDPHKGKIMPVVRVVVFNEKNQCLLLKREKSPYKEYWEVVGGKVEFRENTAKTSKRELFEETGIESTPVFLRVYEHIDKDYHRILFSYFTKAENESINLTEHSEFRWFDINSLPENLIPYTKELILAAFKKINE